MIYHSSFVRSYLVVFVFLMFVSSPFAQAQSPGSEQDWEQGGICWLAEEKFLYCGQDHPMATENSNPFFSFVCTEDYRAVLLSHDPVSTQSTIRKISFEIGGDSITETWMAAESNESFLSNRVDVTNRGMNELLKGLSNPNAKAVVFTITPENVQGEIPLTGLEWQLVSAFHERCR